MTGSFSLTNVGAGFKIVNHIQEVIENSERLFFFFLLILTFTLCVCVCVCVSVTVDVCEVSTHA